MTSQGTEKILVLLDKSLHPGGVSQSKQNKSQQLQVTPCNTAQNIKQRGKKAQNPSISKFFKRKFNKINRNMIKVPLIPTNL